MWDLPGPGLKPVTPALAGGFLTTAPPGKSLLLFFAAPSTDSFLPARHKAEGKSELVNSLKSCRARNQPAF